MTFQPERDPADHTFPGALGDTLVAKYSSCVLASGLGEGVVGHQEDPFPPHFSTCTVASLDKGANRRHMNGDETLAPLPPIGGSGVLRVPLNI